MPRRMGVAAADVVETLIDRHSNNYHGQHRNDRKNYDRNLQHGIVVVWSDGFKNRGDMNRRRGFGCLSASCFAWSLRCWKP